jgi:hypothetical protein
MLRGLLHELMWVVVIAVFMCLVVSFLAWIWVYQ